MTYFVTGANGVGKSSTLSHLRTLLPHDKYELSDFDERGVPEAADSMWRKSEAKYWISHSEESGKTGVICGFVKTKDFEPNADVKIILLDAEPETIRKRLEERFSKNGILDDSYIVIGKPVTEFIDGNVWVATKMKEEAESNGYPIVDTTNRTPEEVAYEVASLIEKT